MLHIGITTIVRINRSEAIEAVQRLPVYLAMLLSAHAVHRQRLSLMLLLVFHWFVFLPALTNVYAPHTAFATVFASTAGRWGRWRWGWCRQVRMKFFVVVAIELCRHRPRSSRFGVTRRGCRIRNLHLVLRIRNLIVMSFIRSLSRDDCRLLFGQIANIVANTRDYIFLELFCSVVRYNVLHSIA